MNFGYQLLMVPFCLGAILFYYLLYTSAHPTRSVFLGVGGGFTCPDRLQCPRWPTTNFLSPYTCRIFPLNLSLEFGF